ncbi:MAG: hypothetical protein O9312_04735 [Hylemonella sp.]|nr:hypothetical protein [Hylemonella sp.]
MFPRKPFSLGKRSSYPIVFIAASALLVLGILTLAPASKQPDFFMPAVAAAAGLAYYLYSQHLQETRLFTELFRQFNERYDALNADLNRIATATKQTMLEAKDKQLLFDYFNLCAEEYLYFKNGFIDPEVWESWTNGMRYFSAIPHISDLWINELASGSYYGFSLDLLNSKVKILKDKTSS